MILKADFHIHSCLSPCGDLSMSPIMIVNCLKSRGITLAALTDHNSTLNCPAFMNLCKQNNIACLVGMEVQTIEEVHVLCLFADLNIATKFGEEIYELMPFIQNQPDSTGDQVYVDENEEILGEVEKYLITSAEINIDDLTQRVHSYGGLVIPAHVDRSAFSLTSQLGFIPPGDFDALETVQLNLQNLPKYCNISGYPITHSSDAHYPEHVARRFTEIDIGDLPLYTKEGLVNLSTIKIGLNKLKF